MKHILCYGDSNTWGLIAGTTRRYPVEKRWTGLLQRLLSFENAHVIEEGLCGRTCAFEDASRLYRNGMTMLPFLLETHAPLDMIVLMLGTNDCKTAYHASSAEIGEHISFLLQLVRETAPETKILLLSPIFLGDEVWKAEFDPEFDKWSVTLSKQLRDEYRRIAQQTGSGFLAASDYAQASAVDMEHLDEAGHAALAQALYVAIKSMFEMELTDENR